MNYLYLVAEFFKTGLFAVGGGLATIPFFYDIASRYDWLDVSTISDMIAVSESTPGPIGVNMATYCGYNMGHSIGGVAGGIFGGIIATLALVLPSVIIVLIVARFLEKFKNSTLVNNAFEGLRPAVCGLIAAACFDVFKNACLNLELYKSSKDIAAVFDIKALVLFAILFVLMRLFKKLHPIFIIIPAAAVGIVLKM
ncbi:MAG: chromate transporter [Clostridia bacterium]|nr:chromate transporter [Clostridia bacterium]